MRISEMATNAGTTAKTLRYYETVGLLETPTRTPAGYRDYDDATVARLGFIQAAQAAGLTLGEIRGIIAFRQQGVTPCGHVLDLIQNRADDLDRRIAELQRLRQELCRLVDRGGNLSPDECSADLVCHILNPARPT